MSYINSSKVLFIAISTLLFIQASLSCTTVSQEICQGNANNNSKVEAVIFEEIRDQIILMFNTDQTYQAFQLIDILKEAIKEDKVEFYDKMASNWDAVTEFMHSEMIMRLERNQQIFNLRYGQLNQQNTEQWNKYIDEPNRKLWTIREEGFSFVTQLMVGEVDASYMNVMTLLISVDQMDKWIPFLKDAEIKMQKTPLRALFYQRFEPPWPMQQREVFVEVVGYQLPFENALVFSMDTVSGDEYFGLELKRLESASEMFLDQSMAYIAPQGPNKTILKMFMNANPRLDYIPDSLIDWGIKTISGGFITYIVQQCTNLPPSYRENMINRREYFEQLANMSQSLQIYEKFNFDEFIEKNFPQKKTRTKFQRKTPSYQSKKDQKNSQDFTD